MQRIDADLSERFFIIAHFAGCVTRIEILPIYELAGQVTLPKGADSI